MSHHPDPRDPADIAQQIIQDSGSLVDDYGEGETEDYQEPLDDEELGGEMVDEVYDDSYDD